MRLTCNGKDAYPDRLKSGDWLSRFLAANSAVTKVVIDIPDTGDDSDHDAHLYLPLDDLCLVVGANGQPPSTLQTWFKSNPLKKIELTLRRQDGFAAGKDLVGLEVTRSGCFNYPTCHHEYAVWPAVLTDLAACFPALQTLGILGFWGTFHSVCKVDLLSSSSP